MANPAIVYPYGTGSATLMFQRPPNKVPAYSSTAVRHDNVASSGVRESVLERIDNYLDLDLEWVGIGSDVQAWAQFMNYALQGGVFAYYPDSSQSSFTNLLARRHKLDRGVQSGGTVQLSFEVSTGCDMNKPVRRPLSVVSCHGPRTADHGLRT